MPDVRQLASRRIYANRWLTLREDDVEFADGSTGIYTVVDKPDYAMVIPYENGGFWLVEQYRYTVGSREWEFPAGGWPQGRRGPAEELAALELREETGLRAARLDHLGRLNSAPGHASNAYDIYLATGLTPGEPHREATESDMRQAFVAEDELYAMVRAGTFRDAHCVAALTLLDARRA